LQTPFRPRKKRKRKKTPKRAVGGHLQSPFGQKKKRQRKNTACESPLGPKRKTRKGTNLFFRKADIETLRHWALKRKKRKRTQIIQGKMKEKVCH
jgi:hypothetical protein